MDKTGRSDTAVIYPQAAGGIEDRARGRSDPRYKVNHPICNGHASKESENFIAGVLLEYPKRQIRYAASGASYISASKLAPINFPIYVAQAWRFLIAPPQDPLAELVKIDPKAIGVGQYQHDMKPAVLDEALSGVVEDCVNRVGVDANTASHSLLSHIAGINATSAKNIVKYREEHGEFRNRAEILKLPPSGRGV